MRYPSAHNIMARPVAGGIREVEVKLVVSSETAVLFCNNKAAKKPTNEAKKDD